MPWAVGLLAITDGSRELCWDAALAKGLPIYGLRDELRLSMTRLRAASVLSALAFGVFDCRNGADLNQVVIDDHREGVRWSGGPQQMETTVVLREGYEIPQAAGAQGEWRDRGSRRSAPALQRWRCQPVVATALHHARCPRHAAGRRIAPPRRAKHHIEHASASASQHSAPRQPRRHRRNQSQ